MGCLVLHTHTILLTHLFALSRLLVGIFPHTCPHSYPPIRSFSYSSGYFSSYHSSYLPTYSLFSSSSRYFPKNFLLPFLTLTHLFTLSLLLVGIFPPACPHSYPPISSFSTSSGYISSYHSSFLPTYSLFLDF